MRRLIKSTLVALMTAGILMTGGNAIAADIYVARNGSDVADGSAPQKALASVGKAISVGKANSDRTGEDITILVGPGIYRGTNIVLSEGQFRGKLTITGTSEKASEYPAFYGNGSGTWLTYNGSGGKATGLTIRGLRIVDYGTAINLVGDRRSPDMNNAGTVIQNNVFARIGSRPGKERSTAAIRLVNSHDNIFENNYFNSIRNYPLKECGYLHSIYIAHYSSGNRIRKNAFQDFCGAAIKLRDTSNDNLIEDNTFRTNDPVPAIQESYCDMSAMAKCTKKSGECPSTGNVASTNHYPGLAISQRISIEGSEDPKPWCQAASFSTPRIRTERDGG